ncbi:MAG: (d)CMP kinase, partial [Deltaproteobacteria bacterium]|nr:(d)CMP kinase [Deltaproteobacteria bacterium]
VVRELLVSLQRKLGAAGRVVMEGRDIGTVVFPDAEAKIFLDAEDAVRAKRRHGELSGSSFDEVSREIGERDRRDRERDLSPLVKAGDAVYVDTTNLVIEDVGKRLLEIIKEKLKVGDINR